MKKVINKLLNVDKKVLLFLIIICIIGITTGSIFMTILSANDKSTIIDSIDNFMNTYAVSNTKLSFTNNIIVNLLYILVIWILGISIIGIPIAIFLLFIKSFLISFTISSFILKYKTKGIIYGIIYNLPHQVIYLLIYLYLGVYSVILSKHMIECLIHKKTIDFKKIINRYFLVLIFSIIGILITTLYETYIMPILMNKVLSIL